MGKYVFNILLLITGVFIANLTSHACTAFMAAKGDKILTGRNADWSNLNARMLVRPASPGKYGTIYLGAEGGQGIGSFINTTGMNDHGLWYGSTSLYDGSAFPVRNDIRNYYNKPYSNLVLNYDLIQYVMEVCSTVDQVIEYFTKYYYPVWNGHHLFVDRNGNSVIIEFGEKDVVFVRKRGEHQVMTNFPNADTLNTRWYNCYRYKTADRMLASGQEISTDLFRSICDAVHQEGSSPTNLTTVYDITNGNLYVYYFHNYEEVLVFNVNEELTKGENYYRIPRYFNQIQLRYPIKGEQVNPSSVTFAWNGNAERYHLYYSTDPSFTNVKPITVPASRSSGENATTLSACWFGIVLLSRMIRMRKKMTVTIILCLIIVSLFLSCGIQITDPPVRSPFAPSAIQHRQTVENLQSNTQYYWKVVAIGSEGINSESIVQTFSTKD